MKKSLEHNSYVLCLKFKYIVVPMIKAMPTVIFRILCFWLLLTYCSEFYPEGEGNEPGLGLLLGAILIVIVSGINFAVGYGLGLKFEEAVTNSVTNLIIPVYIHLFYLVRLSLCKNMLSSNLIICRNVQNSVSIFRYFYFRKAKSTGKGLPQKLLPRKDPRNHLNLEN